MIEMMLVLALIGLIMGTIVHKLRKSGIDAQVQVARMQLRELGAMFFHYRLGNNGDCPSIRQWLEDKTLKSEPKDPWGHPLTIVCPSEHDQGTADIVSVGPDGQPSSRDDIQSWTLP